MRKLTSTLAIAALMIISHSSVARELLPKEKGLIANAVKQQLKDPDSAKFFWQDYKGGDIYCAHVNAKNSYGGFSGKALVLAGIKNDARGEIISAEASIRSDSMMNSICTDAGYQP